MSANLRNARKALRAAATLLRQSAALDTLLVKKFIAALHPLVDAYPMPHARLP